MLEHVTLPRVGAMQTVLQTLAPEGLKRYGHKYPNSKYFIFGKDKIVITYIKCNIN